MFARRDLLLGGGLLALSGWLAPGPLLAQGARPEIIQGSTQFIQWMGDQALNTLRTPGVTLEQREASFRGLMRQGFDIEFIARFVLGRYWQQATPEQRADYVQLFGEFLVKTYARRLGGYSGETFGIVNAVPAGEQDVQVRTRIDRPSGPPLLCDWRVRVINNQYKIIDVSVEGISMAVTQRQDFAAVVQNGGIPALLTALRARTETVAAQR
ncbi:MAG: ABC transporter substrate-binding protein [Alphaproteobacteria bacterium]|nr:ABC transporter substrate-binding protein [Alphaproteobacteria bacterium]